MRRVQGGDHLQDRSRDSQVLNIGGAASPMELAQISGAPAGELSEPSAAEPPLPQGAKGCEDRSTASPMITKGVTERIGTGCGKLYVTVNYDDDGICEVFAQMGKSGVARLADRGDRQAHLLALRSRVSVEAIVKQMKGFVALLPLGEGGDGAVMCRCNRTSAEPVHWRGRGAAGDERWRGRLLPRLRRGVEHAEGASMSFLRLYPCS